MPELSRHVTLWFWLSYFQIPWPSNSLNFWVLTHEVGIIDPAQLSTKVCEGITIQFKVVIQVSNSREMDKDEVFDDSCAGL